jgi:putative transcriptional regulator
MKCPACGTAKMAATQGAYKYDESGLPNVTLLNVTIRKCAHCGEEAVEIPAISQLHEVLATAIVRKESELTSDEFRFLRKYLGYSSADFAKLIDVQPETISRWETGAKPISSLADRLIRMLIVKEKRVENYPVDVLAKIKAMPEAPRPQLRFSRGKQGWARESMAPSA